MFGLNFHIGSDAALLTITVVQTSAIGHDLLSAPVFIGMSLGQQGITSDISFADTTDRPCSAASMTAFAFAMLAGPMTIPSNAMAISSWRFAFKYPISALLHATKRLRRASRRIAIAPHRAAAGYEVY